MSQAWMRIEPTDITKVGWRTVVSKHFTLPTGEEVVFDTLGPEHEQHVGIIALTVEKKVVIARLFRPGPERVMEELPGGLVDDGEEPLNAGIRELREETGYAPSDHSESIAFEPLPLQDAYANATKHYYLITNVILAHKPQREVEETITVDTISIAQLYDNAKAGRMTDIAAVFQADEHLRKMQGDIS